MSRSKFRSIKTVYFQILFVIFAFMLMTVTNYFFARYLERKHLIEQAEDTFISIESNITADFKEFNTMLGIVSETIRQMFLKGYDLEEIKSYMVDMNKYGSDIQNIEGFFGFFAGFGEDGLNGFNAMYPDADWDEIIASGYNPKERPWYILAETTGRRIAVTEPYIDEVTQEVAFTYVQNIYDNNGRRLGIICLDVLLDRIYKFSLENRSNELNFWVLHDKNHVIIAHPNTDYLGMHFRDIGSGFSVFADVLEQEGSVSNVFAKDYLGRRSIFTMRRLDNGWNLGIVTYTDSYDSNLKLILWFLIILGMSLASGLIIILLRINAAKEKSDKIARRTIEEKTALINLNKILNGIDAMILVTDPESCEILFINNTMRQVFDVQSDYENRKCYKVLHDYNERCEFCPCPELNHNDENEVIWEQCHELTGRIFSCYSKYIDWPNKKKVHILYAVDVTGTKKAEREIALKNEQLEIALNNAENANKAKSTFLANMSHEIRTPMNVILGITEIQLRDERLPSWMEEGLEKIYDSGNLLLNIINDILDLSKIEAGKLEIISTKYDIPSLINDTAQLNRLRYDSKPIDFFVDVNKMTPLNLIGDELRIKQILGNILSNAFKYTDKGNIRMMVSVEPCSEEKADEDRVTLVFKVSDTGQGMTPEQLKIIFDEYTRFNMEVNRTTTGTGLGMSITKRLVELMNGKIVVESELNKGTVFTVWIPQRISDKEVCGEEIIEKLKNFNFQSTSISKKSRMLREYMPYGSVLIVDDIESNIYVTKGMLLPYGLKIDTALSGFEAIEKVKAGNVYDIIFMDHMMPKMDGIEAAKRIREWKKEQMSCNIPPFALIALTANALVGQAEMFLENGFDDYISKPIDSRELNQILNEYIRNKKPQEVVNEARQKQNIELPKPNNFNAEQELNQYFILDAESSINTLEEIREKSYEDEIETYEITVHGMKSALKNIGENELSEAAFNLEKAAREKNIVLIEEDTPVFIDSLRNLIKNINNKPLNADTAGKSSGSSRDTGYFKEKMEEIRIACASSDSKAAMNAVEDLKKKAWPNDIYDIIDEINVHLLHNAFNKAILLAENTLRIY